MRLLVILICLIPLMSSCSMKINDNDLIGDYIANHPFGYDELSIKKDGTYIHIYSGNDGSKFENRGRWDLKRSEGKVELTFSKFKFGPPEYGTDVPGYWVVNAQRSILGQIRLVIDYDLDYYYYKKN